MTFNRYDYHILLRHEICVHFIKDSSQNVQSLPFPSDTIQTFTVETKNTYYNFSSMSAFHCSIYILGLQTIIHNLHCIYIYTRYHSNCI